MPTLTFNVTLDADITQEWARLDADVKAAAYAANRLDGDAADAARTQLDAARERLAAIDEEAHAAARILTVKRLSPKRWGRLTAEHPPRPDDMYDKRMGFNADTFDTALMEAAGTLTTADGAPVDSWSWESLVEEMPPGQYEQIIVSTVRLHMERDALPFSLPASGTTPG